MTPQVDKSEPVRQHLIYRDRVCPGCGEEQTYGYCTPGRNIRRLDGPLFVTSQVVHCRNGSCPLRYRDMRPPEEWSLAPPKLNMGFDVLARVGQFRYGEELTRAQILSRLRAEYPDLSIGERSVQNLYELYGNLISGTQLQEAELISEIESNGALVVGLDGAQPMKGHETVWFARDLISGRSLAAKSMRSTTARDLERFLRPVREFADEHGIPVAGIVSDKEGNIVKAVRKVFPRVRHQLCQIHYINNVAKPLAAEDAVVHQKLKKGFRTLRDIERTIPSDQATPEDGASKIEAKKELCMILQSILKDSGKPPFDPPGLLLYDRLVKVKVIVGQMAGEKRGPGGMNSTPSSRSSMSWNRKQSGFAAIIGTSLLSGTSSSRKVARPEVRGGSCEN